MSVCLSVYLSYISSLAITSGILVLRARHVASATATYAFICHPPVWKRDMLIAIEIVAVLNLIAVALMLFA